MIFKQKKIGVISLGCDKNRVDTEKMLATLGYENLTQDLTQAQILIVNSCAFLESARKEAIDTVLECNEYRTEGKLEKLVLTGCLPQKFIGELFDELTEVDVFLGTKDYDRLPEAIERSYRGERVNLVGSETQFEKKDRIVTTPLHYAYLKIADGCNNHCTYCLIPSIRGRYRSEKIEDLVEEASSLGELSELILVAQDVTRYGEDIYGEPKLVELIRRLTALDNIGSVRILYAYPDCISDELIDEIAKNDKVLKYLDIPLQHASDAVLKRMNRKGSGKSYLELIEKLRKRVDGIAIRSTFIAGFPGETEEQFNELVEFLKKARLNNAGFFVYSREEGTPSYKLDGQISEDVKAERVEKLYEVQKDISADILKSFVGKTIKVLTDGIDTVADGEGSGHDEFYGRAYFSAPDIDGRVYFTSDSDIAQGEIYDVSIKKSDDYELYGEVTK